MKIKNILFGILSLLTFATYAQTEKSGKVEPNNAVTEFKVETDNLNELKNFDWKTVKEMFQNNEAEQKITLTIAYLNKSGIDKLRVEVKLTGKTTDLDTSNDLHPNKLFDRLAKHDAAARTAQ